MLALSAAAIGESDDLAGNLLGLQPFLTEADYFSFSRIDERLGCYLDEAKRLGWLGTSTVVVLPELIGAWLVMKDAPVPVRHSRGLSMAMGILGMMSPLRFLRCFASASGAERLKEAFFRTASRDIAKRYHDLFSALARRYSVTLVAGSVILPEPFVHAGEIRPGEGPLRNACAVYRPDGTPHEDLVKKVFPVAEEAGFVKGGDLQSLPVFETPAGRLGVLICADSWYPQCYEALERKGAESLAVPAYLVGDGTWSRIWYGYSGAETPPDVDRGDLGRLTEGEAWMRYAMGGRLPASSIRRGLTVFGRGGIYDLGSDGGSFAVSGRETSRLPVASASALLSVS